MEVPRIKKTWSKNCKLHEGAILNIFDFGDLELPVTFGLKICWRNLCYGHGKNKKYKTDSGRLKDVRFFAPPPPGRTKFHDTQILSYFPLMICFVENQNKLKCFMVTLSWFKKVTFYLEKEIFKYN